MNSIFKKRLIPILCAALAMTLLAVGALADGNPPQGRRQGGVQQQGRPDRGRGGAADGVFLAQIEEKIEALEDGNTQADLTALLKTYQDALSAEKAALTAAASEAKDTLEPLRQAVADARNALTSALSDAGIGSLGRFGNADDRPGRPNVGGNRQDRGFGFGTLDTGAIEALIATLDNSATSEQLTALLKTYTDALEAERAGVKNDSLTQDQKAALRETLIAAADKLTGALDAAGVDASAYTRRPGNTDGSTAPSEPPAASSSAGPEEGGAAKPSLFQRIADWFGGWGK